jgi:hypothetical protein
MRERGRVLERTREVDRRGTIEAVSSSTSATWRREQKKNSGMGATEIGGCLLRSHGHRGTSLRARCCVLRGRSRVKRQIRWQEEEEEDKGVRSKR